MPPKNSRRRSLRLEEKKKTNLKDLLKKSNGNKRKSGIEKDGDFVFKRTNSQLEEKPKKIRKLTKKDIMTPEVNRYEEHSTSIQIPISNSPIRKELKNRRNSLSNRGKRVSSIGNGFNGVPHEQISTKEYYKHLNNDLPDPHKMRQLLIWCSKKKFDEDKNKHIKQKNKLSNEELTSLNIAKVIKEEVVRDLVDGKINISWWNKDDEIESSSSTEVKIIPNEKNIKNKEILKNLEKKLVELRSKNDEWEKTLSNNFKINKDYKINLNNEEIKKINSIENEFNEINDSTYNDISNNLEFDIDNFNNNVHNLNSFKLISSKFTLLKSKKLSNILDSSFDSSLDKAKDIDTDQLLKGISKIDN